MFTGDFLAPARLWLLLIVVAIGAAYVAATFWRRRTALRFTQAELLGQVAPKRPGWRRHVVASLQLAALAAAVVASAQPYHDNALPPNEYEIQPESDGRIVLTIDVSLSMEADDVAPTRLDAAKQEAQNFVDAVSENVEIGVVSFSGRTRVEMQPTRNRERVKDAIEQLELGEGTAIGDALAMSTDMLSRGDAGDSEGPPGVIVLLTDGETTQGSLSTDQGAEIAAETGVPVFGIAFGTLGGVIELDDPFRGSTTTPVPYVPEALDSVAEITGGQSFDAGSGDELADAYDEVEELLTDAFGEPITFTGDEIVVEVEQTWKWVMLAIGLLAGGWIAALTLLRSVM